MRILVCTVHGIGNCIQTLPLINALSELGHQVDVRLTWSRGAATIFENHPAVTQVFNTSVSLAGYDVACCTQPCSHYHSGCTIGRKMLMITPGLKPPSATDPLGGYKKHEVEYNLDLARQLGYAKDTCLFKLPVAAETVDFDTKNAVALGVGYLKTDGHSHRKHWGNENFARFAELLVAEGFRPIILGGKSDVPDALKIGKATTAELVNCCGKLSLVRTFGVLVRCRALVCNETMLVPASAALRIPCLSLVLKEAKYASLVKNSPYRDGVALYDKRAVLTPGHVFQRLQALLRTQPGTRSHKT